jgi:hypothetical protein
VLLLLLLQDMYKGEPGSVLEFDMYHAEPLLPLSDEAIMQRMLQTYLVSAFGLSLCGFQNLCSCCCMLLLQLHYQVFAAQASINCTRKRSPKQFAICVRLLIIC